MVSASNYWPIGASIVLLNTNFYRLRPSGFPPLARAIVPSGTARKAAGDLQRSAQQAAAAGGLPLLFWLFQTVHWPSPEVGTPMASDG